MKAIKPLLIIAAFLIMACKKDSATPSFLTGKWNLVGYSYSAGGPQIYQAVPADNHDYIQFESDGKFTGTVYKSRKSYAIKDSTQLTFTLEDNTMVENFYKFKNDTLKIHENGCIEGCSTSFVKAKN